MSTLFTISSGSLTDSIFARSIINADTTSQTDVLGIGNVPIDVTSFTSDGSNIWGVSFNVKSRSENPTGYFSCKLYDSFNNEIGSCVTPISNFPGGDNTGGINGDASEAWQSLKFDNIVATNNAENYYLKLSANTDGELFFYGLPQLDETIIDHASNLDIVTTGNTTQGSFNPYNVKSWTWFTNDSGYISYPNSDSFYFGTSSFTIDFWCFLKEERQHRILSFFDFNVDVSSTNVLQISGVSTGLFVQQDKWQHIAIVRNGNSINGYVNGILGTSITIANNKNFAQNTLFIGKDRTATAPFLHGYIYNLRIVRNSALYSTNFSLPTSNTTNSNNGGAIPSTNPAPENVSLLILNGENRLEDASPKINVVNSPYIISRSPYYDDLVQINMGGTSLGVDAIPPENTTLRLTVPQQINGAFTIEFFAKIMFSIERHNILKTNLFTLYVYDRSNNYAFVFLDGTGNQLFYGTPDYNFHHYAICRDENNTVRMYIDGVLKFSKNYTGALDRTIDFGKYENTGDHGFWGALSNVRVTSGALYTSNFTIPSTPIEQLPNTKAILGSRYANFPFRDKSVDPSKNELIAGSSVSIVSNVTNYGPGSIYFNGGEHNALFMRRFNSDIIQYQYNNLYLNDPYWTVEMDVRFSRASTLERLLTFGCEQIASNYVPFSIRKDANNEVYALFWSTAGTTTKLILLSASQFQANKWYHFAVTKNESTFNTYVDGKLITSKPSVLLNRYTVANTNGYEINSENFYLGSRAPLGSTSYEPFQGHVDNFAVYKEVIYDGDFSPQKNKDIQKTIIYLNGDDIGFTRNIVDETGQSTVTRLTDYIDYGNGSPAWNNNTVYSTSFDSDIRYIEYPTSENHSISSAQNFTLECWVNARTLTANNIVSVGSENGFNLFIENNCVKFGTKNNTLITSTYNNISANQWYHIAVVRQNGYLSLYVNGQNPIPPGAPVHQVVYDNTYFEAGPLKIGAGPKGRHDGFISDLRLTKNESIYYGDFTPPSDYLTLTSNGGATPSSPPSTSNAVFLYCSQTTVQASTRLLPTIAGNSSIIPSTSSVAAPFTNEEEYTKDSHSGSIFFDGTGDMASVSERSTEFTFGASDFTIEFWYYPLVASGDILKTFSGAADLADGVSFYYASTTTPTVKLGNNNVTSISLANTINTLKQWNHFALTRKGNFYKFFINGKLVDTSYFEGLNLQNDNDALVLGESCNGYISDIRVIKGQSLYDDEFNPPTQALTINNTISQGYGVNVLTTQPNLLVKGVAAGIYDASANNNVLLEGAAFKVSLLETINQTSNYTDNALIFNGPSNKNYLVLPPNPNFDFSGDFWIDFWMNTSKWKTDTIGRRILTLGSVSSVSAFQVCVNASGNDKKLQIFSNTNILSSNFDYADGLWHHVGIGRSGSTLSLYRDGILDTSVVNSVDYKSGVVNNSYIGIYGDSSLNKGRYQGKLVGLRIINGECIHTGSSYAVPSVQATINSDGGTGTNDLKNVVYLQKLNNIVSSINSHMIGSATQSLSSGIPNPTTGDVTLYNVVTSALLPARSLSGTYATFFAPASSSYIDVSTSNFQMKGDWTIETYVYPISTNKHNGWERTIWSLYDLSLAFYSTTYQLRSSLLPNGVNLSATGAANAWSHVAVCRKGNDISLYVNGTRTATTTASVDGNMALSSRSMYMGMLDGNGAGGFLGLFGGHIYNTRIIDGRALYDGNFNTTTVVVPSALSATADTVFLYNNGRDTVYYKPGPIKKSVIGGYISQGNKIPSTITNSLSYCVLNNISIQNGGSIITPANTNSSINITNNGLKIGSGGVLALSASPGYTKSLNLYESKIHVMHGGSLSVNGQPKTQSVTLTGNHGVGSNIFTLNETPTNWLSGDVVLMLPTSASNTQFEELTLKSSLNNKLSTNAASIYAHEMYQGIPTIVNASRNISIGGLTPSRRGWIQFDKSSTSYVCDAQLKNLGRDGATTESLIFNVKQNGYAMLSGCYVDGTDGTNVNATSLYDKCYNLNFVNNTFYKHSGDALCFNKSVYDCNVTNNLFLRSTINGIRLENISLNSGVQMDNNVSLANTGRGTYLDNADGNISGIKNWLNTSHGLYISYPTKGENTDLTDAYSVITEEATNNTVSFDTPFASTYPEETCTGSYTKSISWSKNSKYLFDEDFTIEGFYKFNAASTQESRLFVTNPGVEGIGSMKLTYIVNTRVLKFYTNESTSTAKITVTVPYAPLNIWHHIAVCRNDGVISIYFNGVVIGTYNSNFELNGNVSGIAIGSSTLDSSSKSVYGFRVLTTAAYDSNAMSVPAAPFVADNDTVLLYKRSIKADNVNISNIQNYFNTAGGMYVDGAAPNNANTIISNISSVNNTTFGISISSTNNDYRTVKTLTAKDLYILGNKTVGLVVNNMACVLSGIYVSNSTTNNAQFKLGNGISKISGLTSLMGNNNPSIIIHTSKSYQPVVFTGVSMNKSSTLTTAYTGIPLYIRDTEFTNFHFENSTITNVSTGYSISLSGEIFGSYYFTNTTIASSGVKNLSCLPDENIKTAGLVFMNKNGVVGNHESITKKGKRSTDTTLSANNVAEKLTPYSADKKFNSGSKFVSLSANSDVSIKVKVACTSDYNGSDPRLIIKKNLSIGFNNDVVAYTFPKTTTYHEASITTPTVSENGIIEFYVDCDGTVGSIFIDEWKLN